MVEQARQKLSSTKIGIVGLGLIGGSIAKSLSQKPEKYTIVVYDRCQESLKKAIDDNVASIALHNLTQLKDCDIIFLCTPIKSSILYLQELAPLLTKDIIVTDVCSTKSEIVEAAKVYEDYLTFIAGHPMAGSEKSGFESSTVHLFENAYYILSPMPDTCMTKTATLIDIIYDLGAIPVIMSPKEHDFVTGCISHLPHILASTLVNLTQKVDTVDNKMITLAAGGFKDITRIASSNPSMWQQICLSNKDEILILIKKYIEDLEEIAKLLETKNESEILDFFQNAKLYRDSISSYGKGLIPRIFEINVDIEDRPGIIGEIATILGQHKINIKNLYIKNSRETEPGCLKIAFNSSEEMKLAIDILQMNNFTCFF